jgi:hypothetical protein
MENNELILGFKALIDYFADGHKIFYKMCNDSESELKHVYQFAYNDLVIIRQHISETFLKQLLEEGWGNPSVAATERIFNKPVT